MGLRDKSFASGEETTLTQLMLHFDRKMRSRVHTSSHPAHTLLKNCFKNKNKGSWVRLVTRGLPWWPQKVAHRKKTRGRGAEVMMGVWETGTWQIEGEGGERRCLKVKVKRASGFPIHLMEQSVMGCSQCLAMVSGASEQFTYEVFLNVQCLVMVLH